MQNNKYNETGKACYDFILNELGVKTAYELEKRYGYSRRKVEPMKYNEPGLYRFLLTCRKLRIDSKKISAFIENISQKIWCE